MEYILMLKLNHQKIPIPINGQISDRVLFEIYPPGGWRAYGEVGPPNLGIVDDGYLYTRRSQPCISHCVSDELMPSLVPLFLFPAWIL
jgi:hypothetical protein